MYVLPELPYAENALEPAISVETLRTHHGKHHAGYVKKTNAFAAELGKQAVALEDFIADARARKDWTVFNQAAQVWNHGFYWESMSPKPPYQPSPMLMDRIKASFGDFAAFREEFLDEGEKHFASGWLWVLHAHGEVVLWSGHDADSPIGRDDGAPILVCDLWEHAYYLDRKNERRAYLEAWFDRVANWAFADAQWTAARSGREGWRYPKPRPNA